MVRHDGKWRAPLPAPVLVNAGGEESLTKSELLQNELFSRAENGSLPNPQDDEATQTWENLGEMRALQAGFQLIDSVNVRNCDEANAVAPQVRALLIVAARE
jgi:hypothetical protein